MNVTSRPRGSRRSVSESLQETFLNQIRIGEWSPNQPIPTENDLARQHGVCRSTVRRAIQELEMAGLLKAVRGKGRTVAPKGAASGRMIGMICSGNEIRSTGPAILISQSFLERVNEEGDHFASFAFSDLSHFPIAQRLRTYSELSGVSLMGPAFPSADIPELAQKLPVVVLARDEQALQVPSFFIDYGYHALRMATHLLGKGYRRIVVTHGKKPFFDKVGASIDQGVEWAYSLAGAAPAEIIRLDVSLQRDGGAELYRLIKERNLQPEAIISYGTWVLSGFYEAAAAACDRAMQKVEGALLNDLEDPLLDGKISHFRCPFGELARDAAETLYRLIAGQSAGRLANPYRGEMILRSGEA